ncbi:hypothetical protein KI387_001700 [Taxus chinensis]|uniref:Uncharacterized protein n=1 Tax=Taxus chinensis TaxID=29808 RepID=A0AA38GVE5_TAXCH|nr:hypothetical protein KI387_001700 [Taxus chinensis]
MAYYILRLEPQPAYAILHPRQPEQPNAVQKWSWKKKNANFPSTHLLPGKLSKSRSKHSVCRIFKHDDGGNSLHYFRSCKPTKRGLGELHVAKSRPKHLLLGNTSAIAEKGKHSYDVESVINKISNLPPRGSIARCLDVYKKKLSLNDFSLIFREFAQRGDWQRALRLFKYMQRQQWCKPNEHIYTIMIGILGREGLLDKCSEIFEEMPGQGVGWDVYSFTALINAYGRNGQHETSLHLLARMERERIAPSLITYNTVINACAKGGFGWEGLLGLFAQMRHEGIQPDIITYNTLLGACASRGLSSEAEMVFRTMNEAGIVPNALTYTYVVETFRQVGLIDRVSELLRELELAGNLPDVTAYNLLLEAHAKTGIVKKAVGVFRQMQNAGCTPNATTYSTLLNCYGKRGQYDDVRELFLSMKASSTEPDIVTYNTLIDVFGKGGYFKEVISLFHDMVQENVEPVMETYDGLMLACGRGGLHEDAKQILQHMQNRGIIPSVKVFNGVIEAYGNAALYEDAIVAFNTMSEVGCGQNEDTYNSVINMYARGGLDIECFDFFDRMEEAGMDTNVETYNGLIESSRRVGDFDDAIETFENMQQENHPPNQQTHDTILNVYCAAGMVEESRTHFMEMKEGGSVPSITSYCLMLSTYARLHRWDNAYELLEEMRIPKAPNALRVIGTMIKGEYDDQENWQMVEHVFDTLKLEGVGVGMMFYNAVLDALWWLGQKARAAKVLEEARKRGVFPEAFRKTKLVSSVDVHRMSIGAALTSLSLWLIDTQRLALDGQDISQLASIVTIRGELEQDRNAKEFAIAKAVYSFLKDIKAPFSYVAWSKGRLVCYKSQLQRWILKSSVNDSVALVNSLLQFPGAKIGTIYLQEGEHGNDGKVSSEEMDAIRKELTSV